jgi:hypothetical protein
MLLLSAGTLTALPQLQQLALTFILLLLSSPANLVGSSLLSRS